ncbi:response regulator transcription factor [Lachnobacterium bovis]|uniref:Stage 0 sporulation protein A homolog n=1 Tax=Lachnobacterium bovis TaxID=140626 RepID=A0A1H9R0A6_9FIRM|nr:response regulator transcription factor [Lachnobacterium bovis]SER66132.1 DNA-binding response regulator, OmpR family, contains REC and winged-helix (wHTH) domain [Lachnobacterium bovis]
MYKILICDDEKDIVRALKIYLTNKDYQMFEAYDGEEALEIVKKEEVHLILMDIMMPKMDGLTAMRKIRENSNVPIILITAKSEDVDLVLGLNDGADDYITKPFNPIEVVARVKSQLRRYMMLGGGSTTQNIISIKGIELDDQLKKVTQDGTELKLTKKEYEILKFFMLNPNCVYSPRDIYEKIWKEPAIGNDSNTVAVHIRHLREKIEIDPANPRILKVVFGQGYMIEKGRE